MLIHWLEFGNHTTNQTIDKIDFGRLNLLVGISGAGKTQILKTLSTYVGAVVNDNVLPYAGRFAMCFSVDTAQNNECPAFHEKLIWIVETKNQYYKSDGIVGYEISDESLMDLNGHVVFCRAGHRLHIEGKEMPDVSSEKSVLTLFLPEIRANFKKVFSLFRQLKGVEDAPVDFAKEQVELWRKKKYGELPLEELKFRLSRYSPLLGIFLAKKFVPDLYRDFLDALQASFPYVDEVLASDKAGGGKSEVAIWQDNTWIYKSDIAGGMLKAIYILATSCFAPNGSVILLDELENSLGVNCLDEVIDYILIKSAENNHQLLLTSHHPYIINHIPVENWRIISQKNGLIKSKTAEDTNIDTMFNRQDAFFQLINYLDRGK